MAMAKPVVSTWIRGCREVVVDGETGILVQPRDVPALADAIIRVLSDKDMAHRMGRSGRKRIEHQFELKRIVRKQLDALANLIASTRRIPSSVGGC